MAKELPYYKHEPSEWLEGEIQMCSDAAIVCFQNLCSGYWLKLGCISYAFALHKYCRKDPSLLKELIDQGIVDLLEDKIVIKFLDKQLQEFTSVSEKRSQAANKRWNNANALQVESKSNAIREDKSKGDKIRVDKNTISVNLAKRKKDFASTLEPFLDAYGRELLNDFYSYWTEDNKSGTKFKKELESTWNIERRLNTWAMNDKKFNNGNSKNKPASAADSLAEAKRSMAQHIDSAFEKQTGSEPNISDSGFAGDSNNNANAWGTSSSEPN